MSLWTMIFLLALCGFAYAVWHRKSDIRQGVVRDDSGRVMPANPEREAELQREVEALRARVETLERIATDPARRTAEEIEQLRDE